MKFDQVNMGIIKLLVEGRRSFADIAKRLSVTTNTVRSRCAALVEEGVLAVKGLIDPERLEDHFMVLIGVKLATMELVDKGEEFSRLRGVVSVAVVTGRFDLVLTVLLNRDFGLAEFYTQEVSGIAEVASTETFVVYKNYNWKVPYVL